MDFSALTEYLNNLYNVGVPGCDLAIYRDHNLIYRHTAGFRNAERTEPVREDDTYYLYSCSKLFTTCAAMQLIERGSLSLDDPVYLYLPSYKELTVRDGDSVRPAKRVMTVRHLMSMQSGLDYDLDTPSLKKMIDDTNGLATTRQLMEAKANDPLQFEPGTDYLYSMSHDVLAAVIEVVSGKKFSEYLEDNIFTPLGISEVTFHPDKALMDRMCTQYLRHDKDGAILPCGLTNSFGKYPNFESGGGGLTGTVADCALFTDALACGGESGGGAHILSPQMIQLWRSNQLGPRSRRSYDLWKGMGYSYALGVRTRVDLSYGGGGPLGEFGWDGAAGAWEMVDPTNHVSAFFAMHVRNHDYIYTIIHPTIRTLIYGGLDL